MSEDGKHDWFQWRGMTCCRKCGIVLRTTNPLTGKRMRQSPCKSVVQIGLRNAAEKLLTAIDARHATAPGHFKYVVPWDEARILNMALDLETSNVQ